MNAPSANFMLNMGQWAHVAGSALSADLLSDVTFDKTLGWQQLNTLDETIPGLPLAAQDTALIKAAEALSSEIVDTLTDEIVGVTQTQTDSEAEELSTPGFATTFAHGQTTRVGNQPLQATLISSLLKQLHWQGNLSPTRVSTYLTSQFVPVRPESGTASSSDASQDRIPTASTPDASTIETEHPTLNHRNSPVNAQTDAAPQSRSGSDTTAGDEAIQPDTLPQLSTPFGRHVLTVALGDYQDTLFLRSLSSGPAPDSIRINEEDTVRTSIPMLPHHDAIPIQLHDGLITLGGQSVVATTPRNDSPYAIPYAGLGQRLNPIVHLKRFLSHRTNHSEVTPQAASGNFGADNTATVVSLDPTQTTVIPLPADFPMALYQRYNAQPSRETRSLFNLARTTRNEALQIGLDTPFRPTESTQRRDFSSALGVQAQSQFQESSPSLSEEDAELKAVVVAALDKAGYLTEAGSIRPIKHVADGTFLIDLLTRLTPASHDLFDMLEKIELKWNIGFGEWRDVKDINGTLRTYSFWLDREGSKEASLIHPAGGRANIVMQVNDLFDRMPSHEILEFLRIDEAGYTAMGRAQTAEELVQALPSESVLARLLTEIHYMKAFLKRPRWLERIFGDRGPEYRKNHEDRLRQLNELTEKAVIRCLRLLVGMSQSRKRQTA